MVQKTRAELYDAIAAAFPDNSTEQITPAMVREFLEDMVYSIPVYKTDRGAGFDYQLQYVKSVPSSLINGEIGVLHNFGHLAHSVHVIDEDGVPVTLSGGWEADPTLPTMRVLLTHNAAVDVFVIVEAARPA